ncbi:Arylsulfatase [Rubripirellula lacrimiformis]|uniref:Arylsulfatase n=1 Tax=Rubripirellula lacrimiformis TaxID=1930273 RepID=A0A517NHW9_9BACT|nr:sulfatase [Rubripirellula lacrimiformis]QDT06736.1 Arylsulfatase [Rubripirellula lacrimiformis]
MNLPDLKLPHLIALLLIACSHPAAAIAADAVRPNVVLVLCDDIRWDALSCAGHPHLKTPEIDSLAAEGLYFENIFCTTSLCSPSRASILSGLYAHAHGITNNFTDYPESLASFPRQLQKSGYQTAYIGKWHMGEQNDQPRPGFDHFVTHKGQGKYFDTEFNTNGTGGKVVPGYYTTVVTDMAIEWLKQPRDQPFALMIGQKAPHSFYLPEPKHEHAFDHVEINYPHSSFQLHDKPQWIQQRLKTWHGIYGPLFDWRKDFPDTSAAGVVDFSEMVRNYWGTILSVDESVGRLKQHLKATGQFDNTVFIFMGDNGLLEGEHGMVDKRTAHEPSMRVPMIIRYPGLTPDGPQRIKGQVMTVDVAPTILDLCGAEPLPHAHGKSIQPLVAGDTDQWRTSLFYYYNYEKQFPYTPNVRALRTDRWKYIRYPHGDGSPDRHMAELYDLENDPSESVNLAQAAEHQERILGLRAELERLMKEAGIDNDTMPLDEGIGSELPDKAIR